MLWSKTVWSFWKIIFSSLKMHVCTRHVILIMYSDGICRRNVCSRHVIHIMYSDGICRRNVCTRHVILIMYAHGICRRNVCSRHVILTPMVSAEEMYGINIDISFNCDQTWLNCKGIIVNKVCHSILRMSL